MKTFMQRIFGSSTKQKPSVQEVFPITKLQSASHQLQRKLEAKRVAEMTVDQKIAIELAALRAKSRAKLKA